MKKQYLIIVLLVLATCVVSLYAAKIPRKGYVDADIGLNVRTAPSESASKIGALDNRTQVVIDSVSGNWYHITSPCVGYVHGGYVAVTEYGEAPDADEGGGFSAMTQEEIDKIGCDIKKSLELAPVTKAPAQKLE